MPPKTQKAPATLPGDEQHQVVADQAAAGQLRTEATATVHAEQDAALAAAAAAIAAEAPPATYPVLDDAPGAVDAQAVIDAPTAPARVTVRVLHRLRRNRKLYGPGQPEGDSLELDAAEVAVLQAAGAVALTD